jgi:hypothetical protein
VVRTGGNSAAAAALVDGIAAETYRCRLCPQSNKHIKAGWGVEALERSYGK